MVISRHHVHGSEIDEGEDVDAGDFLDVALVAFGHRMRGSGPSGQNQ